MTEIPLRELRNEVSAVLRRVEAGESLRVTVRGRAVADLVPVGHRPTSMPWSVFWATIARAGADAGLAADLADAIPETTDDGA